MGSQYIFVAHFPCEVLNVGSIPKWSFLSMSTIRIHLSMNKRDHGNMTSLLILEYKGRELGKDNREFFLLSLPQLVKGTPLLYQRYLIR